MESESTTDIYHFPDWWLEPGQMLNVRSGMGTNKYPDSYMGLSYSLWTIPGNCAYLRDSLGKLHSSLCVDETIKNVTITNPYLDSTERIKRINCSECDVPTTIWNQSDKNRAIQGTVMQNDLSIRSQGVGEQIEK